MINKLEHNKLCDSISSVYNYDGLTVSEILSQFFNKINECVDLTNNTSSTIKLTTEDILNKWLTNGTFEDIINTELLEDLKGKIKNINYVITSNGSDDSTQIQNALDLGISSIKLVGDIIIRKPIKVPFGSSIIGDGNTLINSYATTLFTLEKGTYNVTFDNLEIHNHLNGSTCCFNFIGDNSGGFENSVNNIIVNNVKIVGFHTGVKINRGRQINFNKLSIHGYNGILYTGKSAEVNIINSFIVFYSNLNKEGSYGLYSYSEGQNYPEGLTVTNTLFFNFEKNIYIKDLYVGNFTSCHIDSQEQGTKGVVMEYNVKNEFVSFSDCWLMDKGITFNIGNETKAKNYKSKIVGCKFDNISSNAIELNKFAHNININNNLIIGNGSSDTKIGLVGSNLNDNITFNNNSCHLMSRVFVLNGVGVNNTLNNNSHDITSGEVCYSNYVVDCDLLFNHYKIDIPDTTTFGTSSNIITTTNKLKKGNYIVNLQLNEITGVTSGYLKLKANCNILSNEFVRVETDDKHLSCSWIINVEEQGEKTLILYVESGSLTTGYVSSLSITKI